MHQNLLIIFLKKFSPKKKSTFYKLIIALKKEEAISYNDYDRRIRGFFLKKKKKKKMSINRTDEIKALIEWYKNKEEKLICIGCSDDDIIEL